MYTPDTAATRTAYERIYFFSEATVTKDMKAADEGPGWYFSDEVEQIVGPYTTKQEAEKALERYRP